MIDRRCTAARPAPAQCKVTPPVEKPAFLPVMAYVPVQEWGELYGEMTALFEGTLFQQLNKPFMGKRGCCNE